MRISVKSDPEYFDKEQKEFKPFTVRTLDGEDIINITNTKTGEWFEKIITDISIYKDLIMISFKSKTEYPEIKPQSITPSIDEPIKQQEKKTKLITKKETKKETKKLPGKTGSPSRPDKDKIIKFIQTKEHTLEDIQDEFKMPTLISVYYWLAQAKVKPRELPKKKKIAIPEVKEPEEEFKEPDPEDYDRGG
jgi:hypothetical protein